MNCKNKTHSCGSKEAYSHLADVEIDESRRFVRNEASKIAANETVPCGGILGFNLCLDGRCNFLLRSEISDCILFTDKCEFNQ